MHDGAVVEQQDEGSGGDHGEQYGEPTTRGTLGAGQAIEIVIRLGARLATRATMPLLAVHAGDVGARFDLLQRVPGRTAARRNLRSIQLIASNGRVILDVVAFAISSACADAQVRSEQRVAPKIRWDLKGFERRIPTAPCTCRTCHTKRRVLHEEAWIISKPL
eukprot:scaffold240530_cov30-Tisochrysis_lutea.AAC.5